MEKPKTTNLVQDPARTKLEQEQAAQAPAAPAVKLVKVKIERDVKVGDDVRKPGEIVEVDEKTAEALCAPFTGMYEFTGWRDNAGGDEEKVGTIYRARRVDAA